MSGIDMVFEVITLVSLALGGTLLLSVAHGRIQAQDALHIHMLLGTFLSSLMAFYVPYESVMRYSLAMGGIPSAAKAFMWLFGREVVGHKHHAP